MNKEIEQLEKNLSELKKAYEVHEKLEYERLPHKIFEKGDIVKSGDKVGIVGWTENKAIHITEDRGYMGVSLISGTRGFLAPTRRNDWELVDDPYYKSIYDIKIVLTGLEIEDLLFYIGPPNFNPNPAKQKLIDLLKSFR